MTSGSRDLSGSDAGAAPRLALAALLRGRLRGAGAADQLSALDRLDPRDVTASAPSADPGGLPVLAHLEEAVALARAGLDHDDGEALAAVAGSVSWVQTEAYRQDPPHGNFLDGYAHATFLGPTDGGQGPTSVAAATGLLLLAPGVVYPHHAHPADEVYLPLTEARWSHGAGAPFEVATVGTVLHHRPWQPHAMITDARPLLALYLWTGAVTVPATWTRWDSPAEAP